MNTSSPASGLAALRDQLASCATACASAAQRAVDPHLQSRLAALSGQVDAMKTRVDDCIQANAQIASAMLQALTRQAGSAAVAMQGATGDDGFYQAMPALQRLCAAIQKELPAA
ncbi:hypothetical protein [Dyella acidiphila]|uniref:Uncharacterized protein n=1 Tax=Dyella acidiphila TaxID=2775866 RepID=A0ABR9G736_9GAMM|nr:hypothetical protein [Dyella acidiphila]MBE1159858.1 hypothetical protein [Dyella acidiphila]